MSIKLDRADQAIAERLAKRMRTNRRLIIRRALWAFSYELLLRELRLQLKRG